MKSQLIVVLSVIVFFSGVILIPSQSYAENYEPWEEKPPSFYVKAAIEETDGSVFETESIENPSIIWKKMAVHPKARSGFKPWMGYHTITDKSSAQYALQETAATGEFGLRYYDGKPMVAVGKYYANNIGDELLIELSDGSSFEAVVGDFKATKHTNDTEQYAVKDGSVVEFIVDQQQLDKLIKKTGNVSYVAYSGDIVGISSIQRLAPSQ